MPKRKILVVDDEEALRSLLADELETEGFDVQSAGDGEEAIEVIRERWSQLDKFDVILLDIKMGKVDGFEVLKYVKEKKSETRVIMLTAYADAQKAIASLRLGASDFISKPYDLAEILTSVRRVLGERISDA